MSDNPVKVRALINLPQLGLSFDEVGEFPQAEVQRFIDRGRAELVEPPKQRRKPRSAVVSSSDDDTDGENAAEPSGDEQVETES